MTTRVVHCKREPYDVLIDRRTPFGNPFVIPRDGDRETVIAKYREWIKRPEQAQLRKRMVRELAGKTIACWCRPAACHGDVIVEVIAGEAERA